MRPNPFHRRARAAVHSVLATLLATSCTVAVTIPAAYAMPQTTEFADGGGNDGDDVAAGQYDAPDLVGRVSAVSGQVTISHGADNPERAALNWPVTSQTRITVASGASVEFRAGSAALRLAGNSELEVVELDDDTLRLHLNYGTVAVRVRDTDMAEGFELITGQGRVTLKQPSRLRADAGADADDTTIVSVFDGEAEVEGGMTSMNLRAGRRAEVREDGMRTTQVMPDSFDQWQEAPAAAPPALRYVSEQVTGYETLDQYGNWTESSEYGPLWTPSALPAGWAPYQFGRWVWVAPWGWTWIDNAPWGYAPSHYGSWVQVGGHWRWAPGRNRPRPVWAPALVGWGDGHSGNLHRRDGRRQGPPSGWSPLTPHQPYSPFVPGLHTSPGYADRINDYRNGRSDRDRYRRDRTRDRTWDQGGNPNRDRPWNDRNRPPAADRDGANMVPHPQGGIRRPWRGRDSEPGNRPAPIVTAPNNPGVVHQDDRPDNRPDDRPDNRPDHRFGNRPNNRDDHRPDGQRDGPGRGFRPQQTITSPPAPPRPSAPPASPVMGAAAAIVHAPPPRPAPPPPPPPAANAAPPPNQPQQQGQPRREPAAREHNLQRRGVREAER